MIEPVKHIFFGKISVKVYKKHIIISLKFCSAFSFIIFVHHFSPFLKVKNRFGLDVSYNKPDFGDFSKELLLDKVRDFFSLDNVGTTWLGKVMAWKGDLMQPAALFGLGVFAIYTFFRYGHYFLLSTFKKIYGKERQICIMGQIHCIKI